MDSKKQKDIPTGKEHTHSNKDMNEQGEKGGKSQYDQNSSDFSNEPELVEEITEIEVE